MLFVLYIAITTLTIFNFFIEASTATRADVENYLVKQKFRFDVYNHIKSFFHGFNMFISSLLRLNNSKLPRKVLLQNAQLAVDKKLRVHNKIHGNEGYLKQIAKNGKPIRKKKNITITRYNMNTVQLIESHGYKVESHQIRTYDGYILTCQRILTKNQKATNEIVILHHGLLGSSEDWLLLDKKLNLPCLLSDYGYEVWLLNSRGSPYSRSHETIDKNTYEFWDFSWHEMGIYDLPAAISYISYHHNKDKNAGNLYYIGHSMGATALLVLLSSIEQYNSMLKAAFLLGPLAYMRNCKGPLIRFHKSKLFSGNSNSKDFKADTEFLSTLVAKYCPENAKCYNPRLLIASTANEIYENKWSESITRHQNFGGSQKTITHYLQLIDSGGFNMFDKGQIYNLRTYKSLNVPSYNLSRIRLPILLFSSTSDWLATRGNVEVLGSQIPSLKCHRVIRKSNFRHFDFAWSTDAAALVYYPVLKELESITAIRDINDFQTNLL